MPVSDLPLRSSDYPDGAASSPARGVAECAESRLRCNPYLALKNVSCAYHDGVLTLHGCLPTYYLKQMAQATVARVEGVERIVNEIDVMPLPALQPGGRN